MTIEKQSAGLDPGKKPQAPEVVAEAIAAMRDDPTASAAANAIEKAWKNGAFDVDRALREIDLPEEIREDEA